MKRGQEVQVGVKGRMGGVVNGVRGVGEGDSISVLTVGYTLVLDLQILVGAWAWVWKHIRSCYHHALSAVITPAKENKQWKEGRKREKVGSK